MYRNQFVYVIQSQLGPCKIGKGVGTDRLKVLQPGSFVPLFLRHVIPTPELDPLRVEGLAHRALHQYRLTGEWFDVSAEVARQTVEMVLAQIASGEVPAHHPGYVMVTMSVTETMRIELQNMADKMRLSVSDVVDMAVDEYLEPKRRRVA